MMADIYENFPIICKNIHENVKVLTFFSEECTNLLSLSIKWTCQEMKMSSVIRVAVKNLKLSWIFSRKPLFLFSEEWGMMYAKIYQVFEKNIHENFWKLLTFIEECIKS